MVESIAPASAAVRAEPPNDGREARVFYWIPPARLISSSALNLMYRRLVILSTLGMLAGALATVAAAQAPKRALTPDDWDHWQSISSPAISNDGRWVVYSLVPQVGDGELIVRASQ